MAFGERERVLWIGGEVPPDLVAACAERELGVARVEARDLGERAPSACAVLVEFGGDPGAFAPWARDLAREALTHGLLVAFTHSAGIAPDEYYATVAPLVEAERVISVYRKWGLAAEKAARHAPGPGENASLRIEGLTDVEPEVPTLFRRAFHGFEGVRLQKIEGGRSGAVVWIAYPVGAGSERRPLPYLVKKHTRVKIRSERVSFGRLIRDAVPFSHRPNIDEERSLEGCDCALLVQDFVDRAVPLRAALPTSNPGQLVSSVFDGALRGCLSCSTEAKGSLASAFSALKALHWSEDLDEAAKRASDRHGTDLQSAALKALVEGLSPMAYRQSTIHGDLHSDNVFVASGTSHVILIDFGRVTLGPVVADFACLDVSVGFSEDLDEATLTRLYSPPLSPVAPSQPYELGAWISHALRAIRHAAVLADPAAVPYSFAVASYLVRFASYAANASVDRRALAYSLAVRLFRSVSPNGM